MLVFMRDRELFFLFPRKSFNRDERFFSSLRLRDDTDPFLSLTLAYTDVLLEQRDLFARIDQVRLCVCVLLSKTERGKRKREAKVSLTRRFVIRFPIGGGLDCLS